VDMEGSPWDPPSFSKLEFEAEIPPFLTLHERVTNGRVIAPINIFAVRGNTHRVVSVEYPRPGMNSPRTGQRPTNRSFMNCGIVYQASRPQLLGQKMGELLTWPKMAIVETQEGYSAQMRDRISAYCAVLPMLTSGFIRSNDLEEGLRPRVQMADTFNYKSTVVRTYKRSGSADGPYAIVKHYPPEDIVSLAACVTHSQNTNSSTLEAMETNYLNTDLLASSITSLRAEDFAKTYENVCLVIGSMTLLSYDLQTRH